MENESTTRKCTVFLSPKSDIVFKAIFGNAKYVKILISLLKAVLNLPDEEYEEVSIVDPHLHRDRRDGKLGIVDVRIKTKSGKIINIEIQLRPKPDFLNRVIFYQSKMIAAQLKKGENFSAMHKVVSIIIADYDLFPGNEKYHRFFTMCEPGTGQRFADMQEIHTLELKKLPEEWDGTDLHAWLQFFNAKSKEELNMIAEAHPTTEIKQAVGRWAELTQEESASLIAESEEMYEL
ncbi:MAG: Rpn family recombination-promoting nuclease/putative transposase, partial [Spirochaetes bacterium]|nr:Rpn family recombination-promoting nuclease/putative transposase [Spirochaetota bacterium]